jgi:hypothetical protein
MTPTTPVLEALWKKYLEVRRDPRTHRADGKVWRAYLPDETFMLAQEEVWASGPYVPAFVEHGGLRWRAYEIHATPFGEPTLVVTDRHGAAYLTCRLDIPVPA